MDELTSNNNAYADIDKLIANQNSMLEQQQAQQNNILDQQLQMQIDQMNKNKAEIDQNVNKTNSGLYAEYKKASNRYGSNAENLFTQGLGNSGFAESTQTNLYNTYQKNITDTLNNAQKLKADFDFAIQQARQNRDLQSAQFALELYKQKMNLATQEYDLRNSKEEQLYNRGIDERNYNYQLSRDAVADNQWNQQFDYQKSRDAVADSQWAKQFDFNVNRANVADSQWNQQFNYNKERDTVADSQWEKEYQQMLKEAELAELWRNKNYDYQVGRDAVSDKQYQEQFNYQKSRDNVVDNQWERQFALSQQQAKASASRSTSRSSGNKTTKKIQEVQLDEDEKDGTKKESEQKKSWFQRMKDGVVDAYLENQIKNEKMDPQDAYNYLLKHN